MNPIHVIGDYRAQLGETPVWCERSHSLLWVDIVAGKLLRYWPKDATRIEVRDMPDFTSAVLLTEDAGRFLVVSQTGIALYDYESSRFTPLCDWPEARDTRPNEAAIAPDGALWFSSMDVNAERQVGCWYRLAGPHARPQKLLTAQWVPNTLIWWQDEIWFADSLNGCFYRAAYASGSLNIQQRYLVGGTPDGSSLTRDGWLINARWGDAKLVYCDLGHASPEETGALALPVRQPSNCTFGGDTLNDLYITSARDGLRQPQAIDGALLKITTTMTGQPARRFRL
ncbi:gluconolactonase family protein [Trabulsiella guamensis ATCC 49490]|uniref:Gluconolactonase family protein n=1 Tax=Trabulsiella guamensis ATCC 49490 TaxID=1005994 RepID=A0A085A2M4_9ENTR|nr:SMP-30/gluconolactonase/LRE family protein [Trabulsiella guamensis]KFC04469.1 gluconolactonase family protein [Trabulsiella guamensis ATCC 49490]